MSGPKMEGSEDQNSGKNVEFMDGGLVLYPVPPPRSAGQGNNDNDPVYEDTEMQTGLWGTNPWREK